MVRVILAAVLLFVAYGMFTQSAAGWADGATTVQRKSVGTVHLRGAAAYLFSTGLALLAVALSTCSVALITAARTSLDRHPSPAACAASPSSPAPPVSRSR